MQADDAPFRGSWRTGRRWVLGFSILGLAFSLGYRARAGGAPTTQPLFYAGTLEDDGQLPTDTYDITLKLFDMPTGGTELCSQTVADTPVEAGRFRIDASNCADTVKDHPDVYVELSFVDRGVRWSRTALGAVSEPNPAIGKHPTVGVQSFRAAPAGSRQLPDPHHVAVRVQLPEPKRIAFACLEAVALRSDDRVSVGVDSDHGRQHGLERVIIAERGVEGGLIPQQGPVALKRATPGNSRRASGDALGLSGSS